MLFDNEPTKQFEQFDLPEEDTSEYIVALESNLDRIDHDLHLVHKLTETTFNALNNSGLTNTAANLLNVATEALRGSIDYSRAYLIPASEQFDKSSRITATSITHENLKETISDLLDKFISLLTKIYDGIINIAKRIFGLIDNKEKINDDLLAEVNNKTDELATEDYAHRPDLLDKPGIFKAFQYNGQVDTRCVIEVMKNHGNLSRDSIAESNLVLKSTRNITALLKNQATLMDIDQLHSSLAVINKDSNKQLKYEKLVYGTIVKTFHNDETNDTEVVVIRPHQFVDTKPIPVLRTFDIKTILLHNKEVIKNIKALKDVEKELVSVKQFSLDACREALRLLSHEDKDTQYKANIKLNLIRRMLKHKLSKSIKLLAVIPKLNNEALTHSQEYCKSSLSKLK